MDDFYRMTPLEVVFGWVPGYEQVYHDPIEVPEEPLDALMAVVRPALEKPPCYVEFSGGRDSSAILAATVSAARRDGFEMPVPITRRFRDVPAAEEGSWQELVIRHLGLRDWLVEEFTDEFDLLGPAAIASLRSNGHLWPPTIHTKVLVWRTARGGTLISGEGGDEIFGQRRITPLTRLISGSPGRRRAAVMTLENFAPRALRRRLIERRTNGSPDRLWLRPEVRRQFEAHQIDDRLSEPLRWDAATRRHRWRRADQLGIHNLGISAMNGGVNYLAPLHHPRLLSALASRGGLTGYPSRYEAMKDLVGGLLPEEVLRRSSKAEFGGSFIGPQTRQFMHEWKGHGVDQDLVDPVALKREWRSERPHAGTMPLLHAVWLRLNS